MRPDVIGANEPMTATTRLGPLGRIARTGNRFDLIREMVLHKVRRNVPAVNRRISDGEGMNLRSGKSDRSRDQ